jgi:signal transduction histidine kinase
LAEQELKKYQARLKALASELTVTEERERRRIATDLHDNVSQSLALARVRLATVQNSVSEEKLKNIISEVSETMLQAAMETRHLIFDLSSPSMNEIGLAAAISEWLDEQVGERHSIETEFIDNIAADKRKTLKENDRVVLFRNVRELLTNVVKHARAKKIKVSLKQEGKNMKIIVEDDGIGFEQINFPGSKQDDGGFGLFSVQELMADLGGTMEILSEPGKGCKVILTIPSASENYKRGK